MLLTSLEPIFVVLQKKERKKRGGVAKRYLLKRSIPAIIAMVLEVRGCLSEAYAAMPLQEKSKKHLRKKKKEEKKREHS